MLHYYQFLRSQWTEPVTVKGQGYNEGGVIMMGGVRMRGRVRMRGGVMMRGGVRIRGGAIACRIFYNLCF